MKGLSRTRKEWRECRAMLADTLVHTHTHTKFFQSHDELLALHVPAAAEPMCGRPCAVFLPVEEEPREVSAQKQIESQPRSTSSLSPENKQMLSLRPATRLAKLGNLPNRDRGFHPTLSAGTCIEKTDVSIKLVSSRNSNRKGAKKAPHGRRRQPQDETIELISLSLNDAVQRHLEVFPVYLRQERCRASELSPVYAPSSQNKRTTSHDTDNTSLALMSGWDGSEIH